MSRSDWMNCTRVAALVLVALSLIAVSLHGQHVSAERAYQTAAQNYEKSKEVLPLGTSAKGFFSDAKSFRREWREEQEHQTQRIMVLWTGVTSVATCVVVVLLLLTLWETRRAAWAAIDASGAANAANEIMRSELRAWIKVESLSISITDSGVKLAVSLSNKGRTTARNINFRAIELPSFVSTLPPDILERFGEEPLPNEPVTTIFPGDTGDDDRLFGHDQLQNFGNVNNFTIAIAAYYLSYENEKFRMTCQGFNVCHGSSDEHDWRTRLRPHLIVAT